MKVTLKNVDSTTVYELTVNGNKVAGKLSHPTYPDLDLWTDPERYDQPTLQPGEEIAVVHEHLGELATVRYVEDGEIGMDAHPLQVRRKIEQLEAEL